VVKVRDATRAMTVRRRLMIADLSGGQRRCER